jgi:hypothetical protein
MWNIRRLEQLEKHPQVQEQAHAKHLCELLEAGKLDLRACTDDDLELLTSLLCDEEEVKRIDAELRHRTDEELQALIDSADSKLKIKD